jgi:hypothetical protein
MIQIWRSSSVGLLCLLVTPDISDHTYFYNFTAHNFQKQCIPQFVHILCHPCRVEILKKHLPASVLDLDGLNHLQGVAERFEDKMYTAATSQVI